MTTKTAMFQEWIQSLSRKLEAKDSWIRSLNQRIEVLENERANVRPATSAVTQAYAQAHVDDAAAEEIATLRQQVAALLAEIKSYQDDEDFDARIEREVQIMEEEEDADSAFD